MLKLADTSLILINPSPSNVKHLTKPLSQSFYKQKNNIYISKVLSVWWYILIPLNNDGEPAQTGPNLRSFHIKSANRRTYMK